MIPLTKPHFEKEELEEVRTSFESGWVAGQGPKNKELEKKFSEYVRVKHAICVSNCTTALHLALLALNIGPGDEVIVPDFTFPATAHAVMYVGAKPIFVDVDPKTYNIDPQKIKEKITPKTKAIIPVHAFGLCAEMDEIMNIAKEHNLKVIEDAACAAGSTYKNKKSGNFGDIGCFSFHARKSITSGEGGMIVTNDDTLAEKMRSLACFGMTSAWARQNSEEFIIPKFMDLGYNYKLSDISAGILLKQLDKIEKFIEKKNKLAKIYDSLLSAIPEIRIPALKNHQRHTYQSYMILLDKKINRNKVVMELKKKEIQSNIGTYALHRQPVYHQITECEEKEFENASLLFDKGLALPLFYEMEEKSIQEVVDALKEIIPRCSG